MKKATKRKCKCKKCKDTKRVVCPVCHGTGSTIFDYGYRICYKCDGKLIIPCPKCNTDI